MRADAGEEKKEGEKKRDLTRWTARRKDAKLRKMDRDYTGDPRGKKEEAGGDGLAFLRYAVFWMDSLSLARFSFFRQTKSLYAHE